MKSSLFVLVAVLAGLACAYKLPVGENVYILTRSNLSMAATDDWLLILYAPWCPHCHHLLDNVPDIVKEIKALDGSVKIAMIDADAEPAIQMQFSMHGFPSLYLAHEGDVYEFPATLGRHADTLAKWCTSDFAKDAPVSGIKAPFGIPMRIFAGYSAFAIATFRFLETYAKQLGIPPMWFFCGVGALIAIVVITIMILTSRCRRPAKKPAGQRKAGKKSEPAIAAPIIQQARNENPIEGAAIAETEKVQEKVKKAKEDQELHRRATKKDEAGAREQQRKSQKGKNKPTKNVKQQNMPTQQPSKRS